MEKTLPQRSDPPGEKLPQGTRLPNTSYLVRHISLAWSILCDLSTIHITPQFTKIIVFLSIITPVLAAGGDDFANNLFSDLAPLLALFGEQVAKQFLSESTGWADNLMFAMAPLGIITAIVSAIRVAGFPWLKAVVGRGKEGQGQVELELMSSNSLDVGEMWNGQAVVRVVGTPSVFQLIYDPKTAISNPAKGIDVLRNGNPFFTRASKNNRSRIRQGGSPEFPGQDRQEAIELDILWDENYDTELARPLIPTPSDNPPDENNLGPPNISLNARGEPITKFEKWLYASVGVILQIVVLAYEGLISYHPAWKKNPNFLKDGISPSREAFPCTAVGTVSLNLGMLICACVIERASAEEKWMIRDNQEYQVAWVQKGGTVNDQVFEPYIILGHEGQKVIRTSHRCSTATAASLKILVLVGTFVSIFGFVVQFIGLRGMTWSATIAQLAATAIMTVLRSVVRRRLNTEPKAELAIEGYELEYMARKIGGCSDWKVVSRYVTIEDELREINPSMINDEGRVENGNLADRVLQIGKRLGALSQWSTDVDNTSRSLCNAMEQVMNVIFRSKEFSLRDGASQKLEFYWKLMVCTLDDEGLNENCTALTFKLQRSQAWGAWEVTKETRHGIKYVLSLWMLHLLEKEREYRHKRQRTATILEEGELGHFGGVVRVLSWPAHPVDHDIARLWLGRGLDIRAEDPKVISLEEKIPRHRFIGIIQDPGNYSILALIPDTPIVKHLGQELFSQFFSAFVPLIDKINGSTKTHEHQMQIEELENTAVSEIVDVLFQAGLGTRPEILLGIIPHLGNQELLLIHQESPGTPLWYPGIDCRHRQLRLSHLWLDIALNNKELLKISSKSVSTGEQYAILKTVERFRKRILALATLCGSTNYDRHRERERLVSYLKAYTRQNFQLSTNRTISKQLVPYKISGVLDWDANDALGVILGICCEEPEPAEDTKEMVILGKILDSSTCTRGELEALLQEAAEEGYDSVVEAIIDRKIDTRDTDQPTKSALVLSSSRGNTTVVQQLLTHHEFHFPNDYRRFQTQHLPLSLLNAAFHGHISTLLLLIEHIKPAYKAHYQETALILAAGRGHIDMVKELLDQGADPNCKDTRLGASSQFCIFIKSNRPRVLQSIEWNDEGELTQESQESLANMGKENYHVIIEDLLRKGDHMATMVAISVRTALEAAAEAGHDAIVQHLLHMGASTSSEISGEFWLTALQAAAISGDTAVVERLLESQADINQKPSKFFGRTALQGAAEMGHETIVDLLLKRGADASTGPAEYFGLTALQASAASGHLAIVERILAEVAIADEEPLSVGGRTALQAAASRGHLEVTKVLLLGGANVDAKPAHSYGKSALQGASEGGYLEVVDVLLKEGASVNDAPLFNGGQTALQGAAMGGFVPVIERLLEKGADVNANPARIRGLTALQAAAKGGHLVVVDRLLEKGANVNTDPAEFEGLTALQAAAKGGHLVVVDRLLEKGANVNADPAEFEGLTALQAAAKGGHLAVVNRLLEEGANLNADPAGDKGLTALQAAAKDGHLVVVDRLLEKGASVNTEPASNKGLTALQAAAKGGHLVVVDRLLEEGANVNADPIGDKGLTALQAAAKGGHLVVVDRLLENGADINAEPAECEGLTALQAAAEWGHLVVVDRLLENGADVNADLAKIKGLTALQAAAKGGHLIVVDRLLEKGANVNADPARINGLTALQAAAKGGHLVVMDRLLGKGANVNTEPAGDKGLTALQAAAKGGHLVAVDRLLENGADINAEPAVGEGLTALQAAAEGGHLVVVDRLLENGADVNADPASINGLTALQAAAKGGHLAVVDRLLEKGANVNADPADFEGLTALQAAATEGHLVVVDHLLEKGARVDHAAINNARIGHYQAIVQLLEAKSIL